MTWSPLSRLNSRVSVGSFGDTHRGIGKLMRREPREIGEFQDAIHPREYRVFAGAIQRNQWPLPSRLFFHAFGGRFGDNRDWPEIEGWAKNIARTLKGPRR
jgi:menaquinone-dependent protoporphyrinogen oxidase